MVKRYLAGESSIKQHEETGISNSDIKKWKQQYWKTENQRWKTKRNPLSKYTQ